ncbi:hypothetical protein ACFO25_09405 [Paenactinomyces guangxiensis]|uniref:Uncharacterized protein n=1 Tax=Paenactinomyces guangxiensis TaxID=1490290 RepID=A0A7W2A6N5_9BACL|nr:hypothetical protein [Paenactinomyces guangxiensis]MBA4492740.1 hypothetical protein [Paenactinomyces guangxiensis]MBH8590411.1 hypothetical protein [Paenactinomyces guangxiensis]
MRRFLFFLLRLMLGFAIATIAWILFIILQQVSYSEPDQVYLMGTTISYAFVFAFFCMVIFFIFSFFKHRYNPDQLKRRFFVFAAFYLICSPLVILSFDNYLLVTPKGMAYNQFLQLEDAKVQRWRDIQQVALDYQVIQRPVRREEDIRLRYLVYFKDGPVIDLNNYNSPLYAAQQFKSIHRVIIKEKVPVKKRPLPKEFAEKNSFIYEMYHLDS